MLRWRNENSVLNRSDLDTTGNDAHGASTACVLLTVHVLSIFPRPRIVPVISGVYAELVDFIHIHLCQ